MFLLPGTADLASLSPFSLKLDAYLRLVDIPHEVVRVAAPIRGPRGKAPWIEHDGGRIGDSSSIIAYLNRAFGCDPDCGLSKHQRGIATAIQRLVEQDLFQVMMYDRWCRPENWSATKADILGALPAFVRLIAAPVFRGRMQKRVNEHGFGLLAPEERIAVAQADIDALADLLGEEDWYFNDSPSLTDAIVYAFLANIHCVRFASPMKAMIAGHANLTRFIDRFGHRFYG